MSTRLFVLLIALALLAGTVHADCGCSGGTLSDNPIDSSTFDSSPSSSGSAGGTTSFNSNAGAAGPSGSSGSSQSSDSSSSQGSSQSSGISSSSSDGSSTGESSGGAMEEAIISATRGRELFRKGEYNESLAFFNQSVVSDPNLLQGWTGMGVVLSAMGRYNESAAAYMHAARLRPSDADSWRDAGNAYLMAGEYSAAIDAYTRALSAQPGKTGVLENLSVAKAALASSQDVPGNATGQASPGALSLAQASPGVVDMTPASATEAPLAQMPDSQVAGPSPSGGKAPLSPVLIIFSLGCAFFAARWEGK